MKSTEKDASPKKSGKRPNEEVKVNWDIDAGEYVAEALNRGLREGVETN